MNIMQKNYEKFDWNNIYSKRNATIIENILDDETINFKCIVGTFYPHTLYNTLITKDSAYAFLYTLYETWESDGRTAKLILNYRDKKGEINENTIVLSDCILSQLINGSLLHPAVARLPRYNSYTGKLFLIDNYYEEYDNLHEVFIVKSCANFIDETPTILTFSEAKNKFPTENEVFEYLLKNKIGGYLLIPEENILTSKSNYISSITALRKDNCGNAIFPMRYKNLERLTLNYLEKLQANNYFEIDQFYWNMHNILQSTDIETKHHIKRYIKPESRCKFLISDLVFIKNEIENLFNVPENPKTQEYPKFLPEASDRKTPKSKRKSRKKSEIIELVKLEKKSNATYASFVNKMISTYLFLQKPSDTETYSCENEILFGIYVKKKHNGSYELFYSFKSENGRTINNHIALATLKNYF